MVLGMSLAAFTMLHVIISLIAIGTGFVVLYGLINGKLLSPWNVVFLVTTILTSLTGFAFPNDKITPGIVLGVLSAQIFEHVPVFHALAPTGTETPFKVAQTLLLVLFAILITTAAKKFHNT